MTHKIKRAVCAVLAVALLAGCSSQERGNTVSVADFGSSGGVDYSGTGTVVPVSDTSDAMEESCVPQSSSVASMSVVNTSEADDATTTADQPEPDESVSVPDVTTVKTTTQQTTTTVRSSTTSATTAEPAETTTIASTSTTAGTEPATPSYSYGTNSY